MVEYVVYYGKNGERCVPTDWRDRRQKIPPGAKWDHPDEVKLLGWPLIKRDKTLDEIQAAGLMKKYGHMFRYYAKDIPLSYAVPKEFK